MADGELNVTLYHVIVTYNAEHRGNRKYAQHNVLKKEIMRKEKN